MPAKKSKSVVIKLPVDVPAGATVTISRKKTKSLVTKKGHRKPAQLELKRSAGVFDRYIGRLAKAINSDLSISLKSTAVLDAMMTELGTRLCQRASKVAAYNQRKTITLKDAQAAVGLELKGELAKKAITEAYGALTMYENMKKNNSSSTSARCQLRFPVPRIQTMMKAHTNLRAGIHSAIFLTSALEYTCAEILELAAGALTAAQKNRIMPRYLRMVIESDRELSAVFEKANFISG